MSAGNWTKEEEASIRSCFSEWDTDNNGKIDLQELHGVFYQLGFTDSQYDTLMAGFTLDTAFDIDEFLAYLGHHDDFAAIAASEYLWKTGDTVDLPFDMDKTHSRVVLTDEQFQVFKNTFNRMDTNSDGQIDREELNNFLASELKKAPPPAMLDRYIEKFKTPKIDIIGWIEGVIGKPYAVTTQALKSVEVPGIYHTTTPFLDNDGNVIVIGRWFKFTHG